MEHLGRQKYREAELFAICRAGDFAIHHWTLSCLCMGIPRAHCVNFHICAPSRQELLNDVGAITPAADQHLLMEQEAQMMLPDRAGVHAVPSGISSCWE